MPLFKYLKVAFTHHWNLLAFLGGMGFAVLSGYPDAAVPIVLAGELAYLGLLGTHPKFQAYVEAQESKAARSKDTVSAEDSLRLILRSLPENMLGRFKALRTRCLELQRIATQLKLPTEQNFGKPLESFQTEGLDRLLWIYLRLLYSKNALGAFLEKTNAGQIQNDIKSLETRLAKLDNAPENPQREKARKMLTDSLQTSRDRLANFETAQQNYELLQLEIERLENKIQSLSELAVNRQEPDFISGEIDQVASSMVETEQTMNDLRFATGLGTADDVVPHLMQQTAE